MEFNSFFYGVAFVASAYLLIKFIGKVLTFYHRTPEDIKSLKSDFDFLEKRSKSDFYAYQKETKDFKDTFFNLTSSINDLKKEIKEERRKRESMENYMMNLIQKLEKKTKR